MSEIQTQDFNKTNVDFLELLGLCYKILRSLEGKKIPYKGWGDALPLIKQFFVHAMTIFAVKDGIVCKFPNQEDEELFTEFVSTAVLTRSAIEIYYNLRKVFFLTANNEDLFEFEYNYWKLSGYLINNSPVSITYRDKEETRKGLDYLHTMRNRISKTDKFQRLSKKEQNSIKNGKRIKNWKEISNTIGVNEETRKFIFRFLSSFVHADGFSVDQVMSLKSQKDSKVQILIHIKIITIFLSKLIIDLFSLLVDIQPVCSINRKAFELAIDYSEVCF